jgi:tRNA modification GTPase
MILNHDDQTIIAQCTPRGSGALALLRISGLDACTIAASISTLASKKSLLEVPTHTVHFGSVIDHQGATIDQVMFIVMHGPKTFTGQDVVEITCHNNPFLIEAIIQQALASGARLAQEGEFTKRAFLNKKIDLIQAESINELIHASTQKALQQSLSQLEGSFSHWLQIIEKELIKNAALSEASFEFIDEEMEFGKQIKKSVEELSQKIETIKKTFNQQQHIRQGVRIALIGSVNAGKSSLFNALLNKKRSIVTDIAGTTRDVVEAGVYKSSSYWTLIDTAGLRQTEDVVEKEGIERSYQEAQQADCILLIIDSSRHLTVQEQTIYQDLLTNYKHKILIIYTKSDLVQFKEKFFDHPSLQVSVHDKKSIINLEQTLEQKIEHDFFTHNESPFLLNQRHFNLLLSLEKNLCTIKDLLIEPIAYELVSFHLNDALEKVTELSGKTITEQSMDAIFREFCVGK